VVGRPRLWGRTARRKGVSQGLRGSSFKLVMAIALNLAFTVSISLPLNSSRSSVMTSSLETPCSLYDYLKTCDSGPILVGPGVSGPVTQNLPCPLQTHLAHTTLLSSFLSLSWLLFLGLSLDVV
jgi:hypothetical protein